VPEEEKSGFFEKIAQRIVTKKISNDKFEEMFWDLEIVMLENNVAVEVIEKIKLDLKNDIVDRPIRRNKIEETILHALKKSIDEILSSETINIFEKMKHKKPYVVCFFGVNGSGKTTTIAKMAKLMLDNKKKVVLAAADTFRAAAIDQLEIHANNLGVKLIKHDYGSDPAAVAFDAIKYAEAKDVDIVLIDTAGRLHSNTNLIDEMKKIVRVAKPDLKVFIGEAITGNDCIEQAVKFNEAVGVDAIILAKADIDEKGGASISVSYVTKKPILYLGVGQNYADIKQFDKDEIMAGLGLEE
jgi:fused signal recognition particle receptor